MKKIKLFEDFNNTLTEKDVEDYLKKEYTSDWFDSELSSRCYDYIDSEEAEDYDDDYEEAYKNLSTGGAIEYDLLEEMSKDTAKHFNFDSDKKIDNRDIGDICRDHLMDTCTWYDKYIFNRRSTEPYRSGFGFGSLDIDTSNWGGISSTGIEF
jgi:hypothetical protein